ncbi:MAG: tRNA pseudouridine(55) synthase TruB [Elusimicrobia bacterium]|nr:tRNA pseudouridine(55) synthase TruB [Elusimicrobiota bacterium]
MAAGDGASARGVHTTLHGGLLLIDKPKGITSHDAVLAIRRLLPSGTKVGHSGTLDPLASGLLILLVGPATKSAAYYQKLPKVYSGAIRLGTETETGDLDGKVVRESAVPEITASELQKKMETFLGLIEMQPPIYSAVKYKGKPLYTYARKGIDVPRKSRACRIYEWVLLESALPEIRFRLRCSHGTYARVLAVELGRTLGCAAVLSDLRRERIGDFDISDAHRLETLKTLPISGLISSLRPATVSSEPIRL